MKKRKSAITRPHNHRLEIILLSLILAGYLIHSLFIGVQLANGPTDLTSAIAVNDVPYYAYPAGNLTLWLQQISGRVYPPAYLVSASWITQKLGRNYTMLNMISNAPYLLMLMVFTYLLGREIKDRTAGITAAVLLSLYPLVYGPFRLFCIDFPLLGLTVMSVYFLVRSDSFNERKWSVLFAASCGWAMMVKDTFAVFVLGPFLYVAANAAREIVKKNFRPAANLGIAAMVFAVLIAPYYFNAATLEFLMVQRQINEPIHVPWHSYHNLRLFTTGLIDQQLSPVFFLALLLGVLPFFRKTSFKIKAIMVLWIVLPNLVLVFVPHYKTVRYLMPALPAFALITAVGMRQFLARRYGKFILVLIVTLGIGQYFWFTYGKSSDPAIAWAEGSQRLRYFQCSEMNQPLYLMKKNSKILESMYRGITGQDLAGKKELTVFVPFRGVGSPGLEDFLNVYFWFQNSDLRVRQEVLNVEGAERLRWIHENIRDVDFMAFFLPAEEQGEGYSLPFSALKNRYGPWTARAQKVYDWEDLDPAWDGIVNAFGRREIVYSDNETALFLYGKESYAR